MSQMRDWRVRTPEDSNSGNGSLTAKKPMEGRILCGAFSRQRDEGLEGFRFRVWVLGLRAYFAGLELGVWVWG